ncbi:MAG TPA: hypothetical protein VGD91_13765 [Trebonia sp.]
MCTTVQDSTTLSRPSPKRYAFIPPAAWPALSSAKPTAPSIAVPAPRTTSSATAALGSSRCASAATHPAPAPASMAQVTVTRAEERSAGLPFMRSS